MTRATRELKRDYVDMMTDADQSSCPHVARAHYSLWQRGAIYIVSVKCDMEDI